MKDKNPPDERVVYLALKNVFKGPNAMLRKSKAIRKMITQHKENSEVSNLVNEHNIDVVCNMAKALLVDGIFESTLKAKIHFPEVFDVSPAQTAEREASEIVAAVYEAEAIQGAVESYSQSEQNLAPPIHKVETESVETYRDPKQPSNRITRVVPSLFPVYLPLRTQHRVLINVQSILEDACFEFAQRNMPEILARNKWDCSEAGELNLWSSELLKRQADFLDKQDDVGKPIDLLIRSIARLRHAAVHRHCITARVLENFLLDAESFATLLGDTTRLKTLRELRRNIHQSIEELERNKHVLSSTLKQALKKIAVQRAELDRLEEMAIADMMKEDGEYQAFAGKNLEATVQVTSGAQSSAAASTEATVKDDDASSTNDDADAGLSEMWTHHDTGANGGRPEDDSDQTSQYTSIPIQTAAKGKSMATDEEEGANS
ncbi:hypothetical protein F4808DRAFT_439748 [Astrocystis sublimbata]|nr:hypothetical protein F4808DRAFT_439748 [Astrocystis sublimbata]